MTTEPSNTKPASTPAQPKRKITDTDAFLASIAPVVAKPEEPAYRPQPKAETVETTPEKPKLRKKIKKPTEQVAEKSVERSAEPSRPTKASSSRARATMDVEINPGEGTTAIYVRVPRTTHLALKIQALQNQAEMEGPTEIASIVRTAIAEYLENNKRAA